MKTRKNTGKLNYVTVFYSDGSKISTSMNPNLTDKEVKSYFKVGKVFEMSNYGEKEVMAKVKKVRIYRHKK